MAKLYRGICRRLDDENSGQLKPKGNKAAVIMRRDDNIKRNGHFNRTESEINAARAHQLKTGMHDGCYISFTRSFDIAMRFATQDPTIGPSEGFVYELDEDLFDQYGVVSYEFPDPEFPDEEEVSLRAADNGCLPTEIVVTKHLVSPT